jgi:hypothetical protein
MKMKLMKGKSSLLSAVIAIALIASATISYAHNGKDGIKSDDAKESKLQVQYVGQQNQSPAFALLINQSEQSSFLITIKDTFGALLYSVKISGTVVSKTFVLNGEWSEIEGTTIEVLNQKTNETIVYEIHEVAKNETVPSIVKVYAAQ